MKVPTALALGALRVNDEQPGGGRPSETLPLRPREVGDERNVLLLSRRTPVQTRDDGEWDGVRQ